MKAIAENIYTRGQHGIQYVRRRIPAVGADRILTTRAD